MALMERNRMTADELAGAGFVVPRLPKVVRIEPAGACNLHCIHCPTGVNKPEPGERGVMSSATFARALELLKKDLPDIVVLYHGGEPLLNKKFPEMVRQVKELGVRFVKTVSNGMLLTEPIMRGIVAAGLDAIEFSLDGESPEENNRIRVGCDFRTVVANVKRLIDVRDEMGRAVPQVFISNAYARDPAAPPDAQAETPRFLREAFSGRYGDQIAFKSFFMIFWPGLRAGDYERVVTPRPTGPHVNFCDHVVNTISVRWNGDVVPCCYDISSQYVVGNINEQPLDALWNNERYIELRRRIYEGRYPPLCALCPVVRPNLFLRPKLGAGSLSAD
jgi:radical SAM protein with 4Fe4S-binding SPASM domain